MNKEESLHLFDCMHPGFFERDYIKKLPEDEVFAELILPLNEFDLKIYDKKPDASVSFGYFTGDMAELKKLVETVDSGWVDLYNENDRIYCGYVDGKLASFCIVEDMGTHNVGGRGVKIGGPGCVGTLPEFRDKGIGLTMVKNVTQILKEEGYDYSYIHFTGVEQWYEKLGYQVTIHWNKKGVL